MPPFSRASSLDRLLHCAGGAVLGGTDEKSERAKEAADWGTLVHHWSATGEVKQVNGWKNHPNLFRRKLEKSGVRREQWWPASMTHEMAIAYDVVNKQVETFTGDGAEEWKSGHDDKFCTGSNDGWDWLFDTVLWVDDLKTGRFAPIDDHREQVTFYALGVARYLDYRGDINLTITHWPRYPNHGQPHREGIVISQGDLTVFEKRLSKLREDILRGRDKVRLTSGPHCTWCPSRGVCPAYEGS